MKLSRVFRHYATPASLQNTRDDASQYARERRALGKKIKREEAEEYGQIELVTFKDDIEEALGLLEVEEYYLPYNFDSGHASITMSRNSATTVPIHARMIQFANGSPVTKGRAHHLKSTTSSPIRGKTRSASTDKRKTDKVPMEERWASGSKTTVSCSSYVAKISQIHGRLLTGRKADERVPALRPCRELYNYKALARAMSAICQSIMTARTADCSTMVVCC